jgi:8-oxo-dGTP diphosphatase
MEKLDQRAFPAWQDVALAKTASVLIFRIYRNLIIFNFCRVKMRKRPLVGVAAIVIKDNKILLGRRKNSHGEGSWQFPGGHLEYKEEIEACAKREVLEETGIKIKNIKLGPYTNDVFENEKKHYITLFVISEYHSGELTLKEPEKCAEWGWFGWNKLPNPQFLPIINLLKQGFNILNYLD